jgi:diacylglycerol O-acyltransferase
MHRLSMMDDTFLRFESRRQPLHIGVLMLFEPPKDAPADFAAQLVERLRQSTHAKAPFNHRLVKRRGLHYWEEDDEFDLAHHFIHTSLPKPGRIRELLAMVSRVHCGHLDRAYPLWRVYLIEGIEDGRFAVYLKIHHSMVDGVSGMRMLVEAMSDDPEASKKLPPMWEVVRPKSHAQPLPVPTPAVGSMSALRSLIRERKFMPLVRELRGAIRDFREQHPGFVAGGQAPRSIFNQKVSATRRFAAQSYSMPRIRAVARAYEATVNDVVLAMCGSALRRYLAEINELPDRSLVAAVPVSTRKKGDKGLGNEVSFTMTYLATDIDDAAERLNVIKRCMDYNKQRMQKLSPGQLTAFAALMLMPGALNEVVGFRKDLTLGNVVVSHVPGPRQDMYWQGAKLSGIYPASLLIDQGNLNITLVSRHDFIDFGLIACRKAVPHMQKLLGYLEDALVELEATIR